METSSEGERLVFPFVNKIYDTSNAALFYAHNGRLDCAQEQLTGKSKEVPSRERQAGARKGSSSSTFFGFLLSSGRPQSNLFLSRHSFAGASRLGHKTRHRSSASCCFFLVFLVCHNRSYHT